MKKVKPFPRKFASSSAAYRAIRQYVEKHGETKLTMEKISNGKFIVITEEKMSLSDFVKMFDRIERGNTPYRYFPDGIHGAGYYEIKKGDRRRPNSMYLSPYLVSGNSEQFITE